MRNKILISISIMALLTAFYSCSETDYSLGDLTAPSNIAINADIVGTTADLPNGDGTGDVNFTITADNALAYKIDYDASDAVNLVFLKDGKATKKYTKLGKNVYTITAVVYGKGGTSSTITKDITVQSNFIVDPSIVNNLTAGSSKTWVVDPSVAGHLGVGPWVDSATPAWWASAINEKVSCCNCFYTTKFTFSKTASGYTIDVNSPDGIFTKTGSLAGGLPGIPSSGDEGCYPYAGGSNSFSFVPSSTAVASSTPSTKTAIQLAGVNTLIGYGSVLKEYEILELTSTYMYLRVQGTETGNAWYIKMKTL